MTFIKTLPALAASALLFAGGAAFAADYSAPTAPAKPAPSAQKTAAAKTTTAPRTPESIECSKEADAKGLHGAARKTFRASCKSAIKHGKPVPDAKT
jgi:hypothetical protein